MRSQVIPGFKYFLRPVLEIVADQGVIANPRITLNPLIKNKMGFDDLTANEKLESGGLRLDNRIGWALTYLKKSGLVLFPKRSVAEITDRGREFLKNHKGDISPKDLEIFPEFVDFKQISFGKGENKSRKIELDDLDPEEKINLGFSEIKSILIEELMDKLLVLHPSRFEELVLDLIQSLGYGIQVGKIEHTGGSGDFGIDGIIHLDRLGLDKIYLQAKRYKPENKISSGDIQKFYGAIKGRHASKGIFLTTSSFQKSAIDYAGSVSDTIVLIDGRKIAELMIEAEVGVSSKRKIAIPSIDNDYFDR